MANAAAKIVEPEDTEESGDAAAETTAPKRTRLAGKTIVLYIALPALALLIASGGGAYYFGVFSQQEASHAAEAKAAEAATAVVFYDLPEILVNLNTSGNKETFLKIRIALQLENAEASAAIESMIPRVIDNFQIFLREMRPEDLSGSAGMIQLKEELMRRINLAVQPIKVSDVLFKEMLVQ